jgi:cytochrome c oxidase assembly protein subunit 15
LIVAAALAILGLVTPGSKIPAVTLGNLLGGYAMLALLAATAALGRHHDDAALPASSTAGLRALTGGVLLLVFLQAASGGLIGAQFALTACPALDECPAFSFGDLLAGGALDPLRALTIVGGHVVPPGHVAGLHVIHRALGTVAVVATIALAYRMRRLDRRAALLLVALAAVAPLLGAAAIAGMPSLPMTVLHNAATASLVAALAFLAARKAMK